MGILSYIIIIIIIIIMTTRITYLIPKSEDSKESETTDPSHA